LKIFLFSFQGIKDGKPQGMVKLLYPLTKNDYIKINNYILSYNSTREDGHVVKTLKLFKYLEFFTRIFYRIINARWLPSKRFILEFLFDFIASFYIQSKVVIVSTAYLYKGCIKNKSLGGFNVFIAGNPHDLDIYHIYKRNTRHIDLNDPYICQKRVSNITRSLQTFDKIICLNKLQYESYLKYYPSDKLRLLEYYIKPLDTDFPQIKISKPSKLTFCYIAHSVWIKGLDVLLNSFNQIDKNIADLKVGGNLISNKKEVIKILNGKSNISYYGKVDNLNKFYRGSHVSIVPSLIDAGPVTVLESLLCGLPVITTSGCGSSCLIKDFHNGFVVEPNNVQEIYDKVIWFSKNKGEILEMSKNALLTAKKVLNSKQDARLASCLAGMIKNHM
jgi:glycosyltransferase involved in cell wall biosynthesis